MFTVPDVKKKTHYWVRSDILMNICDSNYTDYQVSMSLGIVYVIPLSTLYKNLIINIDYYKQFSQIWWTMWFFMTDINNFYRREEMWPVQGIWRARKSSRQSSDLNSPSSSPTPIPHSHPKLCNRLPAVASPSSLLPSLANHVNNLLLPSSVPFSLSQLSTPSDIPGYPLNKPAREGQTGQESR